MVLALPVVATTSFLSGQAAGEQGEWKGGTAYLLGDASSPGFSTSIDGWSYSADRSVPHWIDQHGVTHEGGWPECLDPSLGEGREVPVRFATTDVDVDGLQWRPVLMVDCRPSQ